MTSYTLVSCIDSRVEKLTKFYGRFQLGPFAPGQALTVANALRRALLSNLSGTSMTLFSIQGASNEYEVLNGVRESVLDLLLNLKQIILTSDLEVFSPQIGYLNVQGPGIVRSSDLRLPSSIYVVDPNQYIATLSANGRLTLKFLICCGKNYMTYNPSDDHYNSWVGILQKASFVSENSAQSKKVASNQLDKELSSTDVGSHYIPADFYKMWAKSRKSFSNDNQNVTFNEEFFQKSLNSSKKESAYAKNQDNQSPFSVNSTLSINKQQKPNNQPVKKDLSDTEVALKTHEKQLSSLPQGPQNNSVVKRSSKSQKIGYFPVDAVFMPVTRVNYLIESNDDFIDASKNVDIFQIYKEENLTNHIPLATERIILEVWTNGSIHPRHAIHKAAKSLIQLFLPFQQMRTPLEKVLQLGTNKYQKTFKDGQTLKSSSSILKNSHTKAKAFKKKVFLDFSGKSKKKKPF